jgi:hypothetical protein
MGNTNRFQMPPHWGKEIRHLQVPNITNEHSTAKRVSSNHSATNQISENLITISFLRLAFYKLGRERHVPEDHTLRFFDKPLPVLMSESFSTTSIQLRGRWISLSPYFKRFDQVLKFILRRVQWGQMITGGIMGRIHVQILPGGNIFNYENRRTD